jgi:hypothetical protein
MRPGLFALNDTAPMPMKALLDDLLQDALGAKNRFSTLRTDPAAVESLIKSLRPRVPTAQLIRIGPQGDGGYLVPDDLAGIGACFSPGVSDISGFELECAARGMNVFLADRSVDGPAETHPRFHFVKRFIGGSTHGDYITLDDWVTRSVGSDAGDLLLQMDIEGFEYEALFSASDALLQRFRIIVCEFHYLDQLWNAAFFRMASRAFSKLLNSHVPVHAHPNNCCGFISKWGFTIPRIMELTFMRADRPISPEYAKLFPHPLDCDNTSRPPLDLPACWHSA